MLTRFADSQLNAEVRREPHDGWVFVLTRPLAGLLALVLVASPLLRAAATASTDDARRFAEQDRAQSLQPIRPGRPHEAPFWNRYSKRFICAPAFDFAPVKNAVRYRFNIETRGKTLSFESAHPWDALTPVWDSIPEGYTVLTVAGLDARGGVLGQAGSRAFYRSPSFSGEAPAPVSPFRDAGRLGLRAILEAPHVQHWLETGKPDPAYPRYCYPAKVMGGLLRGMIALSQDADTDQQKQQAGKIAASVAYYLISISFKAGTPFEFFPPTYSLAVDHPTSAAGDSIDTVMVAAACDAAFGYLDLYDLTKDQHYLDAARKIAATYAKTQEADGTWPLKANVATGKTIAPNRLVPTWIIFLFDRFDRQYGDQAFRSNRERAWQYLQKNPLRAFEWDGQFEDVKPHPPYKNLAREQACDTAVLLLEETNAGPKQIAAARELIRFSEDQFVVWSPWKDLDGTRKLKIDNREISKWMMPCVLEQYACYGPVARSSAILIKTYLTAARVTHEDIYAQKARALGSTLVAAQRYQMDHQHGKGEVPTWLIRRKPINWLNNSCYAASALLDLANYENGKAPAIP
ncbi:MAG TPA: hypothetical protein VHH88_10955 [Verrucomicrobiae bacterium]|nr:hypothetical protein [Verrucomicrobiae bacterium]